MISRHVDSEFIESLKLVLAAVKATEEEQRTAAIVDRMDGQTDPQYDAALDVAVNANRIARRARKAVTASHMDRLTSFLEAAT